MRPRRRCGSEAERVSEKAGQKCADGDASVAPESIESDGAGAPSWVGDIPDCGESVGQTIAVPALSSAAASAQSVKVAATAKTSAPP